MGEEQEIQDLFSNDMADLIYQLETNVSSSFELYNRNRIRILTKPYVSLRNNLTGIEIWQEDLKNLLEDIFANGDLTN